MRILPFIILMTVSAFIPAFAQENNEILITKTYDKYPLLKFLDELEDKNSIRFYYEKSWLEEASVTGEFNNTPLKEVLQKTFKGSFISFTFFDPYTVVFFNSDPLLYSSGDITEEDETKLIAVGDSTMYSRLKGKVVMLSGTITNGSNGEQLPGAVINFLDLKKSVATNSFGGYKIGVPSGVHKVQIQNIGFEREEFSLILYSSGKLNYELFETSTLLKEFTLTGEAEDQNVSSTKLGVEKIDIQNIKQLPTFLGEVDVVKSIQMLPGVSSVGEGSGGFNIRGGGTGQNLVLLDNAPVYNTSHLFGFFSVFNSDIIKDIQLYKGSIPAKFGGRASSVLDIQQKDGNLKKVTGKGGAGLIASRFMVEAPIIKDKTSLLISGRASYVNWILGQVKTSNIRNSKASFYDLSGRVSHSFSDKSKLVASVYNNQDKFKFDEDTTFNWKTTNAVLKYSQSFNDRLIAEFTGFISNYNYLVESERTFNEFELTYNIENLGGKAEFEYNADGQDFIFGFSTTSYKIDPGELQKGSENSSIVPEVLPIERALESAAFFDVEKEFGNRVAISAGVRFALYQKLGEGRSYRYIEGEPLQESNIIDSIMYGKGDVEKTYSGPEPRFSIRYTINGNSSVKFGYNRLQQFVHQVSNTAAISPLAVWKLSNTYIKPQISDAFALGYFRNMKDNAIQTSVEVYYKLIKNALSYKDGAQLLLNETLETETLQGDGRAYGIEMLIRKMKGRLKGHASYTFSRAELRFESEHETETLNKGNFFPADWDRPHNFFLSLNYALSKRYIFGTNFIFTSGRPVTAPLNKYIIDDKVVFDFSERNQFRIPSYHRLDLSLTFLTNHKKNKFVEGSWTFALYNVYGRRNPFSVFFKSDSRGIPQAYRTAVIGVPFPAVTYNFKF